MIVSSESDVNHSMRIWWGVGWEVSIGYQGGGSNKGWTCTLDALGPGLSHKNPRVVETDQPRTRAF